MSPSSLSRRRRTKSKNLDIAYRNVSKFIAQPDLADTAASLENTMENDSSQARLCTAAGNDYFEGAILLNNCACLDLCFLCWMQYFLIYCGVLLVATSQDSIAFAELWDMAAFLFTASQDIGLLPSPPLSTRSSTTPTSLARWRSKTAQVETRYASKWTAMVIFREKLEIFKASWVWMTVLATSLCFKWSLCQPIPKGFGAETHFFSLPFHISIFFGDPWMGVWKPVVRIDLFPHLVAWKSFKRKGGQWTCSCWKGLMPEV